VSSRPALNRTAGKTIAGLVGLLLTMGFVATSESGAAASPTSGRLTNLAHLDFLTAEVTPPHQDGHTTYRMAEEPDIGVLWVYADDQPDGSYRRVGGGDYDAATNTYGQGAYDADDISRAAVAYLTAWKQFGDEQARQHAYQLLRGLTYLQTSSGPKAGNVVLWMQPDGTLNLTPTPPDNPNPSDADSSFWLGRTIWALGTGYAAFKDVDPGFAGFLRDRLSLALDAVERQDLNDYGTWQTVDGLRWPAWLIADGADATSEALYGLVAYVRASGDDRARRDLIRLADGVAAMRTTGWPFGALMPWAESRSLWHSWGAEMAGSLATAGAALDRTDWIKVAVGETAQFTPHLIAQGGPDNQWMPALLYRDQIAYGADVTLRNLLRTAEATHQRSFRQLAGVAASWYFGNNPAGIAMYDPATGVTFDGISPAGDVNHNAGAESTIHGLMSMMALDAAPDVAARARQAAVTGRVTWTYAEAESGQLSGQASVVRPDSSWTGESEWSGGEYVRLERSGHVAIDVRAPVTDRYRVMPVFDRQIAPLAAVGSRFSVGDVPAGVQEQGGAGPQGVTSVPGYLDVGSLPTSRTVPAGPTTVTASYVGDGRPARLDGVLLQPEIEWVTLAGPGGGGQALLRSFATQARHQVVNLGSGTVTAYAYDAHGRLVASTTGTQGRVDAQVAAGGFTIVATN
jgi:YD repeat-containing protein